MKHQYTNSLEGTILLTDEFESNSNNRSFNDLYKFFWVQEGEMVFTVDHVEKVLHANEIISLSPLHNIKIKKTEGKYIALLFNTEFYSIYKHDEEVSCNGLLFNGTSNIIHLQLPVKSTLLLHEVIDKMIGEYLLKDNLEGEMLRLLLKRFIILCTRLAREYFSGSSEKESGFDLVRQYYILVDTYFKEKKQVKDYAEILHRSPKTLSNIFSSYHLASPLRIIHERTITEAKRLLQNSPKSAKEIATILGFENVCSFSRFFKHMTGLNVSDYRKQEEK